MENHANREKATTGSKNKGRQNAESRNQSNTFSSNSRQNHQNWKFGGPVAQSAVPKGKSRQNSGQYRTSASNSVAQRAIPGENLGQDCNFLEAVAAKQVSARENSWKNSGEHRTFREVLAAQSGPPILNLRGEKGSSGGPGDGVWARGSARSNSDQMPSTPMPEPPVQELQQLQLSTASSTSPLKDTGKVPLTRPDKGGEDGVRSVRLMANHFRLSFDPNVTIFHYDLEIEPEKPPKRSKNLKLPKSEAIMLKDQLFADELSQFSVCTAYDGKKNIYSSVELPTGKFSVTVARGEDVRPCTYYLTINLAKRLKLSKLESYFSGTESSAPRDVLQALDVIMRESPSRTRIPIRRGFYCRSPSCDCELGDGIVGCKGFQQRLSATTEGMSMCIDYTAMPLLKPIPVLNFLQQHLHISFSERTVLDDRQWRDVERALKGLNVTVTHRQTNQKYKVIGLTRLKTTQICFEDTDSKENVKLVNYFMKKYNRKIIYKHLPCLDLTRKRRLNYVPMEFCVLVEGQMYPRDALSSSADRKLRSMTIVSPETRKELIYDIVNSNEDGPCGGEIAQQFHIAVSKDMTKVMGRVLSQPALKLRDSNNRNTMLTPRGNCQWNLVKRKVFEGKDIKRWAILDFSHHSSNWWHTPLDVNKFIPAFMERSNNLGVHMGQPLFYQPASMKDLSNPLDLNDILKNVYRKAENQLQILLCPMGDKHSGYKTLKLICETEIGIVTQCFLSSHANKCRDQFLANLALKINTKTGGSNVELYHRLPRLEGDGHVMFIGADVNHPSGQNPSSPSIASVVATINWPAANRYASRLRAQPRGEKIENLGEMCFELLEAYARINRVKPEKIIFFRDGVSESQFNMVLNEELINVKRAIDSDDYSPAITLVVAQKRHHTRLFPMTERDGSNNGNVSPGTVVDKTIVHPEEFDFYLCSHDGSLGTSKPTHYHVLYDENKFRSDELQRIIYNLCYTFPRCTKPISLVPPVYYADLVAYRGRQYYESLTDFRSPGSTASSSSSSPSSSSTWSASSFSPASFDHISFPKVHSDLENHMIFC